MATFEMTYDGDEDVLEVTFAAFDERFSRTVALNDHIFVFTDLSFQTVWGFTFYSFSRLLGVSETDFTTLREASDEQIAQVLNLLSVPPASLFFDLTDPEALIARVGAPRLDALVKLGDEQD